ncbi:Uncharacterised protein [Orientia tsutsugamushi]|nr:Uncharacterised protein [Orientia tsutsugamushi]
MSRCNEKVISMIYSIDFLEKCANDKDKIEN